MMGRLTDTQRDILRRIARRGGRTEPPRDTAQRKLYDPVLRSLRILAKRGFLSNDPTCDDCFTLTDAGRAVGARVTRSAYVEEAPVVVDGALSGVEGWGVFSVARAGGGSPRLDAVRDDRGEAGVVMASLSERVPDRRYWVRAVSAA